MKTMESLIESLRFSGSSSNGRSALKDLGFISCTSTLDIKHVPFYDPCIILVLSGQKVLFEGQKPTVCETGAVMTVPAPFSYDLRNEPDPRTKKYSALIVPFKPEHLDRLTRSYTLMHEVSPTPVGILKFAPDETLHTSIAHYLTTIGNAKLLAHRLMEVLLVLATKRAELLSYSLQSDQWGRRTRAVLASDLSRGWEIREVCARLATTESTLRRNLKREDTSFRELLYELRMATALMQILQTSHPIYRVAYDCGYQSVSRFTSNFHKRFGIPPSQVRASVDGNEHILTGSGQS